VRYSIQAIILDGDQRSALAALRSLGRRGIGVAVGEAHAGSLAASSRFCRLELRYPDPTTAPADFVLWLRQMDTRYPGAVLLPMTDVTVPLVLEAAPELKHLRTALPPLAQYSAASDKRRLAEIASGLGVRAPRTEPVSSATLAALDYQGLRYPVVVKPRQSTMRVAATTRKRGVRYASDPDSLRNILREMLLEPEDELLVQEYIEGHGAGVFALYDHGVPKLFFAHRRIREKPPSGGVSVLCESAPLPEEGVALARTLLDAMRWHGVAMVELKVDSDGHPWLIEINARFWGSLQLAVDSGADFPWLLYQLALGEQVAPTAQYAVGNRLRWWLGDLDNLYARLRDPRWTPTLPRKILAVGGFLLPSSHRTRYEFLRWNDPMPAMSALRQYVGALRGRRKGSPTVMHLIDTGGPGGAETVFAQLADCMRQRATRTVAVVPREDWLSGRLRSLGIEPLILAARGSLNVSYLRALIQIARRHRAKLIHTHLLGSAIYGALVGLLTRTPVIAVLHGPTDLRKLGKLASLKRWLLTHACSVVVAVSSSTRDALLAFGLRPETITMIRNGVDTSLFSPGHSIELRTELGMGRDELLIGAVGNIRTPKAYDVLLKAAALVLERAPQCRFAIVGQGDESALQPLRELASTLGVAQRCQFLGFRKSTPELYRNFDVFVSSSRSEGLSLAFLEAMATGLPVVATRSGGPQEVMEPDVTGVLVPIEDPRALADGLLRTIDDPGFRAKLGAAARERVIEEFSLESVLRQYAQLYNRLL
jgi:glycosyltransferase involved in cell wall biosynthesis/predicted ATP-grasp superfamily ATP-dependent carboligase